MPAGLQPAPFGRSGTPPRTLARVRRYGSKHRRLFNGRPMEPEKGFEPPTCRLQGGCSTTELLRLTSLSAHDYILAAFHPSPKLLQGSERLGGEPVGDASAEGSIGGSGYGRKLVEELPELAWGRAGGASGESGALQGEVGRVDGDGAIERPDKAFYDVVGRFARCAVDHAH